MYGRMDVYVCRWMWRTVACVFTNVCMCVGMYGCVFVLWILDGGVIGGVNHVYWFLGISDTPPLYDNLNQRGETQVNHLSCFSVLDIPGDWTTELMEIFKLLNMKFEIVSK